MAPQHQADQTVADGVDLGVATALDEVAAQLAAPDLGSAQRMVLLQRQAELGDFRDELALRVRRRSAAAR